MARLKVEWLLRSGTPLGPRVDGTFFEFESAILRAYHLSIRSYNRAGVGSPEPQEITVTPGQEGDEVRVPTDIDLVMYISHDEKYDQTGELMEPQLWKDGFSFDPDVAPTGSTEHGRRMRYDQGYAQNHMVIDMGNNGPPSNGGYTVTQATTSELSSPCNRHSLFGDTTADVGGAPGGATGRKLVQYSDQYLIVDRRVAPGGQTDVDFLDDFTLVQWINPCLLWPKGFTWGYNAGHRHPLWARMHNVDITSPSADVVARGWAWTLGVPPWFWGGWNPPPTTHINRGVNGFTFLYLPEGDLYGLTAVQQEDLLLNSYGFFWPYEYEQGLDSTDDGAGFPVDAGQYCGWLFCAMTVSAPYQGSVSFGGSSTVVDAEMWVGRVDAGDLTSLGVITGPQLRQNLWTIPSTTPRPIDHLMVTMNQLIGGAWFDDSLYEDRLTLAMFGKFDESRIYSRALANSEIRGLYHHPGGQKRTENTLELDRQVP
jgi:hypothetical protein